MADPSEAVANFVAITGADEAAALSMLEATNFQLEAAVNLFFASGDAGGDAGGGGGLGAGGMPGLEDDEALARRLQQEGAGAGPPPLMEEEVRAPLPVRTERLYGDEPYRPAPRRPANPVPQNVVDAFRDFRAEAGGSGAAGAGGSAGPGTASLASMFEPPRELLYHGSFEEAKASSQEQGRWLIVNLQSTSQFASHQLNRDTWRDEMVRSLVENNFVLFQAYETVEEGQKLLHFYKVLELPAIIIIDPVTGAPMRQWAGYINAERLTEELLPFLDYSIHDPGASKLARRARSKKDLGGAARQGSGAMMAEDEELQRALEMSMAAQGGAGGRGAGPPIAGGAPSASAGGSGWISGAASSGFGTTDIEDEEQEMGEEEEGQQGGQGQAAAGSPAPAPRPAAEVQAEASARLPEEPSDGSGCRIAVRLPDGKRSQRRFPASSPVSSLYDWCLAESEEAAGGRPFSLSQGFPGAPALDDQQQTLESAQLAGAMLVLKWKD